MTDRSEHDDNPVEVTIAAMVGIAALLGATPGLANATPIEPVRVEQKARTGEDEPWLFYEGSFDEWMQA